MAQNQAGLGENGRTRNWTFIVYPDSAPADWEKRISSVHIPWAHSPLHDADFNADGSEKKPHWHCLLKYDSVKTAKQVKDLLDSLDLHCTIAIPVQSLRGLARYFCHLDNPDKTQYRPMDCFYQGIDWDELCQPTTSEKDQIIADMMDWINDNGVEEYWMLLNHAKRSEPDWFHMLTSSCTLVMLSYLRSIREYNKQEDKKMERLTR